MGTYLVTGAAGFIGFHLCKRLLTEGHKVIGIDNINDYYDPTLKLERLQELGFPREEVEAYGKEVQSTAYSTAFFIRLNLEDYEAILQIFRRYHFDAVIHLAAQAGVRYSIDHPFAYTQSNITGFLSILEACRHTKVPHLLYASSSSVYGLNSKQPFSVHDGVDHPISLYAATKRANELMAHTYSHLYSIPTTGLRFFTVYGPWGRPDMAYFKFARAILAGEPIEVYNHGEMYRDFTYIDDVIEGIVRLLGRPPRRHSEEVILDPATSSAPFVLYNVGNNKPEKLSDFIRILETNLGKEAKKRYLPLQKGDVLSTTADVSDLNRVTNWKPTTSIENGLEIFCKWFISYIQNVKT